MVPGEAPPPGRADIQLDQWEARKNMVDPLDPSLGYMFRKGRSLDPSFPERSVQEGEESIEGVFRKGRSL